MTKQIFRVPIYFLSWNSPTIQVFLSFSLIFPSALKQEWSSQSFGNRSIKWHLETPTLDPKCHHPLDPYPWTPPPLDHHHLGLLDPHHPLAPRPPPPLESLSPRTPLDPHPLDLHHIRPPPLTPNTPTPTHLTPPPLHHKPDPYNPLLHNAPPPDPKQPYPLPPLPPTTTTHLTPPPPTPWPPPHPAPHHPYPHNPIPLTPTTPYPHHPLPLLQPPPPDPHHTLPPPPPGRVLCTVLVTIPWAGPIIHLLLKMRLWDQVKTAWRWLIWMEVLCSPQI